MFDGDQIGNECRYGCGPYSAKNGPIVELSMALDLLGQLPSASTEAEIAGMLLDEALEGVVIRDHAGDLDVEVLRLPARL